MFIGALHMLFLLYLHFAYHELAESKRFLLFSIENIKHFLSLAVSHALNNEATVPIDLPVKPVLPVVSQGEFFFFHLYFSIYLFQID